jgi:microcystin-dependent protein
MSLYLWDTENSPYQSEQLVSNFSKIDQHDHSSGRGIPIQTAGIQNNAITSQLIAPGAVGPTQLSSSVISIITGMIIIWPGASLPGSAGSFLYADGTVYNIAAYPNLYSAIGNTYGGSSTAGTFAVPDLQNNFVLGAGNSYTLASEGGSSSLTLSAAQLPVNAYVDSGHSHIASSSSSVSDPGHTHVLYPYVPGGAVGGSPPNNPSVEWGFWATQLSSDNEIGLIYGDMNQFEVSAGNAAIAATSVSVSTSTSNQTATASISNPVGGNPVTNLPPYIALSYIIKT